MGRTQRQLFFAGLVILLTCVSVSTALARQTLTTYRTDGQPLFLFEIFDKGEAFAPSGSKFYSPDGENSSSWTFGQRERGALHNAADHWASLLGNLPENRRAVPVVVGGISEINADAISLPSEAGSGLTELADAILRNDFSASLPLARTRLGEPMLGYYGKMEVLPHNGATSHVTAVLVHELSHAMGILASRDADATGYFFEDPVSNWTAQLHDSFGSPALPGKRIDISGWNSGTPDDPAKFSILSPAANPTGMSGYAFFQGPETMALLRETHGEIQPFNNPARVPGLPVNGIEGGSSDWFPEFSHLELRNSSMSHQLYRNYAALMEAELAVLQDIGIPLDRKNHFGFSVYGDDNNGTTHPEIIVSQGYFARNAEGTAYLPGRYNLTALGVGLHLYGVNNVVRMQADVLSRGYGGAGIRVDGWDNTLTIAPGSRIHSNGERGTALMVAYGKDHIITQQGELQANGPLGVGARFDFGDNPLGNTFPGAEYRGSWIHSFWNSDLERSEHFASMNAELQRPLVKRFDVTGPVSGRAAAIYMSKNALVEQVNIMRGARLTGDIISDWNPDSPLLNYSGDRTALVTDLTFGFLPDAGGNRTDTLDHGFFMDYRGDIRGRKGIDMTVAAGTLAQAGTVAVRNYTLGGSGVLLGLLGDPLLVEADTVNLEQGSRVGVFNGFSYGPKLLALQKIMDFQASDSFNNFSALLPADGRIPVGFYDYGYETPFWDNSAGRNRLMVNTYASSNKARTAVSAVTAPLAMLAQNPGSSLLREQIASRLGQQALDNGLLRVANNPDVLSPDVPASSVSTALQEGNSFTGGSLRDGAASFWFTPVYSHSEYSGSSGYTIKTPSFALGVDRWLNDNVFAGMALSSAFPDYTSGDADIQAKNITGMLYAGTLLPYDVEAAVFGTLGHSTYDQTRKVHGQRYDTDYVSENYSLGLNLGRGFFFYDTELWRIRPFAAYEYMHLERESYNEGRGPYALHFGKDTSNLHKLDAGLEGGVVFDNGAFVNGRLWYQGLYGARRGESKVYFSQDPARDTHNTRGAALDAHSLGAGVDCGLAITDDFAISGGYDFLGGEKTTGHQVNLGLTLHF